MCGFLAEFTFNNYEITTNFEKILALSRHRGPDSTNIHSENNYQLDMQPLASSLYFYQILDKNGTLLASGKLVKSSRR